MRSPLRSTSRSRPWAPSRASRAPDGRAGFTLIELLAALVISGVVVAALFQLLAGQGRFVEMQSAREEVSQNTRAALELIGSELRTLPSGDALIRASADSITFRSPRVWGVVCEVPGATSIVVSLPAIAGGSYTINSGTGAVLNLGTAAAPAWSNAVGVTSVGGAVGTCAGEALPAGVEARTFSLSATPQNGTDTPAPGDNVYLYDQVTYRTGTSASVPGLWIQRRLGEGGSGNQPMAGPVEEDGTGLRFSYFDDATTAPLGTPIVDAGVRESVSRVMVTVHAVSRNGAADVWEEKADTVIISLRNRI